MVRFPSTPTPPVNPLVGWQAIKKRALRAVRFARGATEVMGWLETSSSWRPVRLARADRLVIEPGVPKGFAAVPPRISRNCKLVRLARGARLLRTSS